MLGSRVITFASILVVLIFVVLSITAAPISDGLVRREEDQSKNETLLQTDEVAVSSNGDGKIQAVDPQAANDIDPKIKQNGTPGRNGTKF